MKSQLIAIVAAVLLVGCGESQPPETPTAKTPDTSIHDAAGDGNIEAVKKLQDALGMKDPDISIHDAVRTGNIEAVKKHLAAGTDVNAKKDVWDEPTPLHRAASEDHKEIAELLIAKGADVNATDGIRRTPLHLATSWGHKELVALLIAKGADVNATDNRGRTPLEFPIRMRDTEIINLIREHGGRTGEELKGGEPVVEATQSEPTTAKAPDISIHQAAEDGNIEAVKQYLDGGVDVNAKDKLGWTPMFYAAFSGRKEIAELLIAKGADVNAKSKFGSQIPLYFAAQSGYKEIAELLIENGADVNAKNDRGWTPLYAATYGGYNQVIELLIAKGADVNAKSDDGRTSVDYAEKLEDWRSPEDRAAKKEIAALLRKHGGKTGEELKAEGK
jgi:ankyrin repeat protein